MKTDRETPRRKLYRFTGELPRLGQPGSRSAELHAGTVAGTSATTPLPPSIAERNRFEILRILGMVGTLLIGLGGLGAGALPVVNNPYGSFPFGALMGRMMVASSSIVLLGVGFLVLAWLLMGSFVGADGGRARVGVPATPFTLMASAGHSSGSVDDPIRAARLRPGGSYWDWSLGVDHITGPLTLGLVYTGTDISERVPSPFANARDTGDRLTARVALNF